MELGHQVVRIFLLTFASQSSDFVARSHFLHSVSSRNETQIIALVSAEMRRFRAHDRDALLLDDPGQIRHAFQYGAQLFGLNVTLYSEDGFAKISLRLAIPLDVELVCLYEAHLAQAVLVEEFVVVDVADSRLAYRLINVRRLIFGVATNHLAHAHSSGVMTVALVLLEQIGRALLIGILKLLI